MNQQRQERTPLTSTLAPSQLRALSEAARKQLASYKAPKRVIFVSEVPRAPNGKADYKTARQLAIDASA